ncbi:MAG TPA: tRNA (guanosine(46)-N7)-methyltransferase TrmB [Phycisphaerae bacterium]|nr:tRNA (guanosine(46)-N7)-methyltransferase TrmB [Phycisphaerae bacterium]
MIDVETIAVPAETFASPVDPRKLFSNGHPLEMEIGCGKGGFLLRQARAHPDRNYLGVEWANKFYKYAADRMARWGVGNVRVVRTDAKVLVMTRLVPCCLSVLHVYHPDPWPKKRHHKRRLICPKFAEAVVRVLELGGRWAIQTDHADYFEQIKDAVSGRPELQEIPFDDADYGTVSERTETNYEIKYLREGRHIFRLALRRVR